jgi:hypothetical protein
MIDTKWNRDRVSMGLEMALNSVLLILYAVDIQSYEVQERMETRFAKTMIINLLVSLNVCRIISSHIFCQQSHIQQILLHSSNNLFQNP